MCIKNDFLHPNKSTTKQVGVGKRKKAMDYFQDACFLNNHLYVFACKLTNIISILIKGGIAIIAISTAKFIWFMMHRN